MINYVYNILAKPILGRQITHFLWNDAILLIPGLNYLYLFILIFLCLMIFMFKNYKNLYEIIIKNKVLAYLIYIFFSISILVLVGAAGNYVGGRYAVIPGVILLLILLHLAFEFQGKKTKLFFIILISISLISGINEFRPPTKNDKNQYIRYLDCINCPDWKSEVKKWKNDNTYTIGIWPYPKKTMNLK